MALLTAEQILAAEDLRYETVQVPEWGGEVRVGTISGAQRIMYEAMQVAAARGESDAPDNVASLVLAAAVNAEGKPLFTEKDVAKLAAKSMPALRRVFDAALRLNMLSPASLEELKGN